MPDLRFIEALRDATLIPNVYNACDQWCEYCPVTSRCLAFRCSPQTGARGNIYENIADAMQASLTYLKERHESEGQEPPAELLWLLDNDPRKRPLTYEPIDDPLEGMAAQYAVLAARYLASRPKAFGGLVAKRPDGPTPFEVFLYYHLIIAMKVARALSSSREAARGTRDGSRWDADASAKVALVGIDRSDDALHVMKLDDPDPRIDHMRAQVRRLRREVEARFPAARGLVRPGLDDDDAAGRTPSKQDRDDSARSSP